MTGFWAVVCAVGVSAGAIAGNSSGSVQALEAATLETETLETKTLETKKMTFLQEVRAEAKAELEEKQKQEAEEQAKLAQEFSILNLARRAEEKERAERDAVIAKQEEAIALQGARYLEHTESVDVDATIVGEIGERVSVSADDNDGYAKEYAKIFTISGAEPTWESDYYDVAIPYNLTCGEVGGVAENVESSRATYNYDAEEWKDEYVGCRIQQEFTSPPSEVAGEALGTTIAESGVEVYEWGGKQLYAIALPRGLFPEALESQGFSGFSSFRSKGILADLILTDGTVISCVVVDGIGEGHSNGLCEGWTATSTATAQDGVRYELNALNYPQYKEFFHAASCHTVELSGDVEKFKEYFGIGTRTRISYVRIYKYSMLEAQ